VLLQGWIRTVDVSSFEVPESYGLVFMQILSFLLFRAYSVWSQNFLLVMQIVLSMLSPCFLLIATPNYGGSLYCLLCCPTTCLLQIVSFIAMLDSQADPDRALFIAWACLFTPLLALLIELIFGCRASYCEDDD